MKRAVALGFFDGVHIGHGALLEKTCAVAEEYALSPCVMTYKNHPSEILLGKSVPLINTPDERCHLISSLYGITDIVMKDFTKEYAALSCEEFFENILIGELDAAHVVAGENFTFGKNKSGNADVLKKLCAEAGIKCTIMPCKKIGETVVSSSEIRKMIADGNIRKANEFLGRKYGYSGTVKPGTHIGVKLGYPTANITPDERNVLPPNGVYASLAEIDGKTYKAITNIGIAPTFDKTKKLIETNILDFESDIYNKEIFVFLTDMIRQEKKFASADELCEQIEKDIEKRRCLDE